ncbi:MAG: YpdA family putative bacillithiol disulfide reductase [Acidobacteriota bacterium]|nr:YpdA family putative bacillithiol disulfide reductase [Acidobacteriota bacterium]
MTRREPVPDLLVVGAGPTGIAIGAEVRRRGLSPLLVDRGPLAANLLGFPAYMNFFTTRDLLEIAGVPFAIPHDKPTRREALAYYRAVADKFELPVAQGEEVVAAEPTEDGFVVSTRSGAGERRRPARAVALATGYFHRPRRLCVEGEDLPWVRSRYIEPYGHFRERVVVVGGGNSAVEAALELWRNGVSVTLVHRRNEVKPTVKYWLKPDFENRVAEGSIEARFDCHVTSFGDNEVRLSGPGGDDVLETEAVYVLIGYSPDAELERRCGVRVDPETLVPVFDPETCESNIPGLYVAGTLQSGTDLGRIFIENSREHALRIVEHLSRRLRGEKEPESVG